MTVIQILAAIVVIGYLIGRRLQGQYASSKRLVVIPLALAVVGLSSLHKVWPTLSGTGLGLLAIGAVSALTLGGLRGSTVELQVRNHALWYRYRARTVVLWVATFGVDAGLHVAASIAHQPGVASGVLFMVGLAFGGESVAIYLRSLIHDLPFPLPGTQPTVSQLDSVETAGAQSGRVRP